MTDLRTNCLSTYWLPDEGDDNVDGEVHISLTEYYEVIDPALPYEERFRTDHLALSVNGHEWKVDTVHLLELAEMFVRAARWTAEDRIDAQVSPSGEQPPPPPPGSAGSGGGTDEGTA